VIKAITAQAGTSGYTGVAELKVSAAGLTESVDVAAFTGASSSYGYRMVSGVWFAKAGEIVVATPFLTATRTKVGDTITLTNRGVAHTVRIVGEAFNTENRGLQILADAATFATSEPDLQPRDYNIVLKPGTDAQRYVDGLNAALTNVEAHAESVETDADEFVIIVNTLAGLLTVLLIVVAALGVLNMVVLETRERVHDLGVHKALGMTPRQTISMVISSVVVTGLVGGAVGVPAGVLLQHLVITEMAGSVGFALPASVVDIYHPGQLALYGLGGLVIAVLGALLPAGWAAGTRTATALRTE
jgi:putative ABC transport system permease protein